MSAPKIGINENVSFDFRTATVADQPVLNIVLTQPENEDDLFDISSASTEGGQAETTQVTSWPIKVKGLEDGKLVDNRRYTSILSDIKDRRAYYTAILQLFMDKNQIEWDPFRGLDINTDSVKANPKIIVDDTVLAVISKNFNDQLVEQFKAFGDASKLFRVTLLRSSKKSVAPKLRDRYLDKNVIAEPMEVPIEESKVGFTAGEIKAGLDNDIPLASDTDGKDTSANDTLGQVADPAGVPSNL